MYHQMGLKLTLPISKFKTANSSMLSSQPEVEHPLEINSKFVVSLTLPKILG
jgi:hypothetical protein